MAPGSPGPATLVACFLGQVTLLSCSYWLNQAPAEEPAPPAPPAAFPAAEPPPVAPACAPPGHTDWAVGLFSLVTFLAGIGAAAVIGLAAQVSGIGAFCAAAGTIGGWAWSSARGAASHIANSPVLKPYRRRHGARAGGSPPAAIEDW